MFLCFSVSPLTAGTKRPNIVTLFIDDMGWADVSCFGGKAVKTEHIDRLAAEGIRFTEFPDLFAFVCRTDDGAIPAALADFLVSQ